jgi:hypothetical protein
MHHSGIGRRPFLGGRAVVAATPADQMGFEPGQRADRIGATPFPGAWIVLTDGVGDRIQSLIERGGVFGGHIRPDRGRTWTAGIDLHEPVLGQIWGHPHPVRVVLGDPVIDPVA